jgi:hypothetical protein
MFSGGQDQSAERNYEMVVVGCGLTGGEKLMRMALAEMAFWPHFCATT